MKTANQLNLFHAPQLNLFEQPQQVKGIPKSINITASEKANLLLETLNEDIKPKNHYQPHYTYQEKGIIVLIAINPDKDVLCNAIEASTGNTPNGFIANWRHIDHVKKELLTLKN